uniref:DNA polymerase kappa n=1 Tax=Knipowitschia caucasica TaxID=637954 RepID=A0AAV2MRM5_KNICA
MEGLDRDKINAIIMEASKGSRFYESERKRDQQVNQRIEKMMQQKASITEEQLQKARLKVEKMVTEIEKRRDLSRIIVHVDMDAFYAAVETRDCPELKDKPMAVGSLSMLSTSNYHARKYGVRAAMPGFIAKKLCPDLAIVPTNFDKYRAVSKEVQAVFAEYDPQFQSVSLDEAYLDFTEHLEQRKNWTDMARTHYYSTTQMDATEDVQDLSPVLFEDSPSSSPVLTSCGGGAAIGKNYELFGTSAEEAVREMRFRIEQKIKLTASAGIAPNMMLAKVCSDKNKPNGQYRLPPTRDAVMDFIQKLPVRKVPGIGKVSEKMLNALGICYCSDLGQQMALLSLLFSETAWHHFMELSLGLGSTYIPRNEERKSMSTERTFKELSRPEEQLALCKELCEDLAQDMKKEGLKGKTITVKLKNVNFEVKTRAITVHCAVATAEEVFAIAKDLLKAEMENVSPHLLRLRLMGVRVSAFVSTEDKKPLQKSIIGFFQKSKKELPYLCLNQDVLHTLAGQTIMPEKRTSVTTTSKVSNQLVHKAAKGKSKRRDSPLSPPPKKAKAQGPRNTIDRFFSVKAFTDFVQNKNSDKEPDGNFDNKEMLLLAEKQFIEAAKRNDIETMKVVGKGLNANAKNVNHQTALHFAVARKNKEAVQFLLQRRVKVDQKDKHGVTAIHLAAWFGSLDILKLLVKAGAEQKIENEEGLNILHCAAINNHTEIVEYIINDLIMKELDKEDSSGQRPFSLAAKHGCVEMLEMLMDSSYSMGTMQPNKSGDTPLHLAARNGHGDTVQLLLLSFDIRNEVNKDGETALYQAADRGHEECVQTLLEAECDPNIITNNKRSALHSAAERGDTSLVRLLLQFRTQTECSDQNLQTPFHLAVKNGHLPVMYCLLHAGCNYNAADKWSQTAMHIAAEMGKVEVIEMLLKAGINLSLQDKQGKTALEVAARAGEVIAVDMIIKAERYDVWKMTNPEMNQRVWSEFPLTFKLDHRHETKQLRSTAWHLAYKLLKLGQWKRLAEYWGFTTQQVQAIDNQWTGQQSYQEHGNRMLLIWLHGVEMANASPMKELYQSLVFTHNQKAADIIRMEPESDKKSCRIS